MDVRWKDDPIDVVCRIAAGNGTIERIAGGFYVDASGESFSHAETNNSACAIAARRAGLKNWRSLTALAKCGDEHFVCLACCCLSAHVEGSHAHDT